jgi:hypothetical protein
VGNDNICCCSGYRAINEQEIRQKVEQEVWEFASEFYNADREVETLFSCDLDDICKKYTYSEVKTKYDDWKADKEQKDTSELEEVTALADRIGIHRLYALVKKIRGE